MAAFDPANSIDVTDAASFIPELWSDEIVAAYKANLVLAGICTVFSQQGSKGDVINIPSPNRLSAAAKAENDTVTLQTHVSTGKTITINKHYESERLH